MTLRHHLLYPSINTWIRDYLHCSRNYWYPNQSNNHLCSDRLIVCLRSSKHHGEKCQFHQDRLSVDRQYTKQRKEKLIGHFHYPRSSTFFRARRDRFFSHSSLLTDHGYSIRIQISVVLYSYLSVKLFISDDWQLIHCSSREQSFRESYHDDIRTQDGLNVPILVRVIVYLNHGNIFRQSLDIEYLFLMV